MGRKRVHLGNRHAHGACRAVRGWIGALRRLGLASRVRGAQVTDPREAEAAFHAEYPNCAERMKLEPHVVEFHDAWVEGFCFRAARSAAPVADPCSPELEVFIVQRKAPREEFWRAVESYDAHAWHFLRHGETYTETGGQQLRIARYVPESVAPSEPLCQCGHALRLHADGICGIGWRDDHGKQVTCPPRCPSEPKPEAPVDGSLFAIAQTLRFIRGQPCMAEAVRSELTGVRRALDQEYQPEAVRPTDGDIHATARRIIEYMLDRGPIAPSSELTATVKQELLELERRLNRG